MSETGRIQGFLPKAPAPLASQPPSDEPESWQVSLYEEGDKAGLLSLLEQVFGPGPRTQPSFFDWYCLNNPAGKAIVIVSKSDLTGEVLGEGWIVPLNFQVGHKLYTGGVFMNLVVHPNYRNQHMFRQIGLRSREECLAAGFDFCCGYPNLNSTPGGRSAGWYELPGSLRLMLYPFNVKAVVSHLFEDSGSGALFLSALAGAGVSLLTPLYFRRSSSSRFGDQTAPMPGRELAGQGSAGSRGPELRIEKVDSFLGSPGLPSAFDLFWQRVCSKYPIMGVRDAGFLQWRYGDHPTETYETLVAIDQRGQIQGYLIFCLRPLYGLRSGVIVDFLVDNSTLGQRAGLLLVNAANNSFRATKATLALSALAPGASELAILARAGYRHVPERFDPRPYKVFFRTYSESAPLAELACFENWFLTFGDFDVF